MEIAVKSVIIFLLLYFTYYYVLRFIQSVFQGIVGCINRTLLNFIYAVSTPAHELAHLIAAVLFRCRINKVKFLPSENRPGYVSYSISRSQFPGITSIKGFFIGAAPALINIPLFIFIESRFILKCHVSEISRILNPQVIMSREGLFTFILFIVLLSGIAPSHQDLKGMVSGLITLSLAVFGITYITGSFIDIRSLDISSALTVTFYYLEILLVVFVINGILNYNRFFRMTSAILVSSLKHTFSKS